MIDKSGDCGTEGYGEMVNDCNCLSDRHWRRNGAQILARVPGKNQCTILNIQKMTYSKVIGTDDVLELPIACPNSLTRTLEQLSPSGPHDPSFISIQLESGCILIARTLI